jgi:hypothetical protein
MADVLLCDVLQVVEEMIEGIISGKVTAQQLTADSKRTARVRGGLGGSGGVGLLLSAV